MQLRDYARVLLKRAWVIVLVTVIAVACALAISKLQTPIYRSTIYLNVWPGRLDWGLQQTIKGIMRNYAGIMRSRDTAQGVVEYLGLTLAPEEVQGDLKVSSIESDLLIQIDVDNEDPLLARDIAQTTADIFVDRMSEKMKEQDKRDRVEVTIRDYALPGALYKPKLKINLLAGAVLGAILGLLLALLLEWLEADLIRTAEEMEQYTGVAVLGLVPSVATGPRANRSRS